MGNSTQSLSQLQPSSLSLPHSLTNRYLIKQFITHSPQQQQLISNQLARLQQHTFPNIIKLLDSHTSQAQQLCSIITQLYAIMQKPKYTLSEFMQEMQYKGIDVGSKILFGLLLGCIAGISFLKRQQITLNYLQQQQIYVDESNTGQLMAKIMNPFFMEQQYTEPEQKEQGIVVDLGRIFQKYLNRDRHNKDLIDTIDVMSQNAITLQELQQKLGLSLDKKVKSKLKLAKHVKPKTIESQRQSFASSGSSLMIDGGQPSQCSILKDLYQNQSEFSRLSMSSMDFLMDITHSHNINYDLDSSHQFPKKYLRNKPFRKTDKKYSEWSDLKDDKQNITRDQSLKQNVRLQPKPLLESAKLVQSFIRQQ